MLFFWYLQERAWREESRGALGIAGDVLLFKPFGYINESGVAVACVLRFYKVPPSCLIVIHDDADLAFGRIKAKIGGGHAGHNGLKSIDRHLGTSEYTRVRVGIGKSADLRAHVLGKFGKEEDFHLVTQCFLPHAELLISDRDTFSALYNAEFQKLTRGAH